MELQGALVRGNGFYDWMVKKPLESIVDAMSSLSVANTYATYRPPQPCGPKLTFTLNIVEYQLIKPALEAHKIEDREKSRHIIVLYRAAKKIIIAIFISLSYIAW